jgi:phosphoribosyl 1,2-cyclic phosphodiesterase
MDTGAGYLLVDAGLSAKQLVLRMALLGVAPEDLCGILLTHEHGDHVKGLEVFARKHEVPVYVTALTREVLARKVTSVKEWKLFAAGQEFEVAGLQVTSFAVPHDAVDPVGFVFQKEGVRTGLVTDLGHVSTKVTSMLDGVSALVLESNYCDRLLEEDEKRPWSLKQRISSRHGHLSNAQSCALAGDLVAGGLERVILGHLSRDCNTAQVAAGVFEPLNLQEVQVASQTEVTGWMRTEKPESAVTVAEDVSGQEMLELF